MTASPDRPTFCGLPIPVIENIHKRIYEAVSEPGAFDMGDWHQCGTTHCRGGFAVHLAGDEGYALEKLTGPLFAAMMIYKASGYPISPVRFFDSNEAAMEDMRRLAEGEPISDELASAVALDHAEAEGE